MKLVHKLKKTAALLLAAVTAGSLALPAAASEIKYLPDVTAEMSDYRFWADLQEDAQEVILTMEEIEAFNRDTIDASGTKVMDIKGYADTFDGIARNEALKKSSTADAEYYFGWTYDPDGNKADWSYYQQMIDNCYDPRATRNMPFRYGVAVNRTVLKVFPSDNPIWDDPADVDFDYQSLSAVRVNEPVLIYTTSRDGKYFMARTDDCSGWIAAEDVAVCANKEEWLSAWDLPSEDLLVVYGNKIYTETSIYAPEVSRRMLTQGTALELVKDVEPDQVIINRYPYHNYVVYLPVRRDDGSYEKQMAFISETAAVHEGYLPLTKENIAMVTLENLGDTYGWGGMLDVEDCSGMVRTVYECFGLDIARNGNWQWNMHMEKIDMSYMSIEEKTKILDELPLGAALCFTGHEMIYLGAYEGKYYVLSTVGSIMSPDTGNRLRVRGVILNTLDIKRANGQTWLQALNKAFMPCYPTLEGKTYDFPTVEWYRDGIYHSLKNGLISNYDTGCFGPDDPATRGVAVEALWRLAGRPEAAVPDQFTDVSGEHSFSEAICWAVETGIAGGYGNGLFGPEDILTREQAVTILWRCAQYKGYDLSSGEDTNILSYGDADEIAEYAIPAMQWACSAGLLVGRSSADGTEMILDPNSPTTRAQLSVMLMRFDAWMETAELLPVYHTFDLSQGDMIISAGAEEYAASSTSDKTPAPTYVSQDDGMTWTRLEGELRVITSEATDNWITADTAAPYGDITITLDGVNTTGDLQLSPCGETTLQIKGDVFTGTIVTGLGRGLTICSPEEDQPGSLTVSSSVGYGIISGGNICIENLSVLNITAEGDGIYTETGHITIEAARGTIQAGEGYAALKSNGASAVITVNGKTIDGAFGPHYTIEG